MLKFRGFKASLDLISGRGIGIDHFDKSPGVSINGAYRTNKDEIYNPGFTFPEPPKKITPSMVQLPNSKSGPTVKPSKSVSDLTKSKDTKEPSNVRKSTPDVSQLNNNGVQLTKTQIKEQKKLEKQRLDEQKKREKLEAQEQKKQEKLRKEREKQTKLARQEQEKKERSKEKKRLAPKPQKAQLEAAPQSQNAPRTQSAPQPQKPQRAPKQKSTELKPASKQKTVVQANPQGPKPVANPINTVQAEPQGPRPAYPTNTLESSISRSSGPPPYTSMPEVIQNQNDDTGNTSFSKPDNDSGSWDLISQHRQQINRQTGIGKSAPKQKHLDLNYNVGSSNTGSNSDV